jgi:hypothetical protein
MASISTKFGLGAGGGTNFKEPWLLNPYTAPVAALEVYDSGNAKRDASTTAFFTEMARRGLQDQTNWTADTYKTILSVSSGSGLVAAYVGCTAGGVETHTVEITVDGVLKELVISGLASGERACLFAAAPHADDFFTTAGAFALSGAEALDSNKQIWGAVQNATESLLVPWVFITMQGIPCLRFNQSLLIRAKHSTNITNSTATAYSAVMYRLGL